MQLSRGWKGSHALRALARTALDHCDSCLVSLACAVTREFCLQS
jgi:hypothetical protein